MARLLEVTHHEQHGQLDSVGGKIVLHDGSLPRTGLTNILTRERPVLGPRRDRR